MMTEQPKPKRGGKAKADKASSGAATGFVIDSADPAVVAEALGKRIREWPELKQTQRDELVQLSIRSRERPTRAKVASVKSGDAVQISPPEQHQASHAIRIYETFATSSDDIVMARITEIQAHFAKAGDDVGQKMSAALAFVAGCNPENEQQSAMATQLALIHDAAMTALGAAKRAEFMDAYEKYSNQANKLSRTFAVLTDSYAKLQRGGVQTVKHVNVYEGGQAVVAEHVYTGGMNAKRSEQAHATGNTGAGAAMLSYDAQGHGVPVPCSAGAEAVQDARLRQG